MDDDRQEKVAELLRPVLQEGDSFNVHCEEGEVIVQPADTDFSLCSIRHPRLYGRLLAVSGQLDEASAYVGRFVLLAALILGIGTHLRWFENALGDALNEKLDHWLFYALIAFIAYQIVGAFDSITRVRRYRALRLGLLALIAEESLDRDRLLAMIEGDSSVERAGHFLKLEDLLSSPPTDAPPR